MLACSLFFLLPLSLPQQSSDHFKLKSAVNSTLSHVSKTSLCWLQCSWRHMTVAEISSLRLASFQQITFFNFFFSPAGEQMPWTAAHREENFCQHSQPHPAFSHPFLLFFNMTLCRTQLYAMMIEFSWNKRKDRGEIFLSTFVPLLISIDWNLVKKEAISLVAQEYICNAKYHCNLEIILQAMSTLYRFIYTYIHVKNRLKI